MGPVIRHWTLTEKTQVRSQASPCGICSRWSHMGTGFYPSISVFPCQYNSINASYSLTHSLTHSHSLNHWLTYNLCYITEQFTALLNNTLIIIIIITMAQQPYMGPGLLLPPLFEVTKSWAFVAVGDWSTGRATVSIDPNVPARAIWQAVRRLGWENGGNLAYATFLFMPVRFFYMP
jgi:hypothetical protein